MNSFSMRWLVAGLTGVALLAGSAFAGGRGGGFGGGGFRPGGFRPSGFRPGSSGVPVAPGGYGGGSISPAPAVIPTVEEPDPTPWQTTRKLRVTNGTTEKLTVYVQVKTQNQDDRWVWYPAKPGGDEALAYELKPGQVAVLTDGDWEVNGSRARVWAVSARREYATYRDKDLWLVPETNGEGYHGYESTDLETFELTIR